MAAAAPDPPEAGARRELAEESAYAAGRLEPLGEAYGMIERAEILDAGICWWRSSG
jgi:hypothetical protein